MVNLKEIIDKLQSENIYFKTQVEILQSENKQLVISNENLSIEVNSLKEILKTKDSMSVCFSYFVLVVYHYILSS